MSDNVLIQKKEFGNIKSSMDYFLQFDVFKKAKILDVGCRDGSLICNLYHKGYQNTYGVDIDKNAIEIGQKKYRELKGRIQVYEGGEIPYREGFFDVVLMFDVIEHIPNLEEFLEKEVHRVLKRGGLFIFQTPNKYINIPWEVIHQRSFRRYKDYHCSLQTLNSLRKITKEAGFKDIVIEKNDILTQHNKLKIKRKAGFVGLVVLYLLQKMPLLFFPNFWGKGVK